MAEVFHRGGPEIESELESEADDEGVVWVDAGPFRAYLVHVMTVGEMPVEVVAAMAGVSARAARSLLTGRGGRAVRRISAETGRRLLRISSADARSVRRRLVSAHGVAHQLTELRAAGVALPEVARRGGLDATLLADIQGRRRDVCSPLVAAQVAAVHTAFDVGAEGGYPLAS